MNQTSSKNPSDFLKQALGRSVSVKLTNNTEYRGILICLDQNLNIALEQCEEVVKRSRQLAAHYRRPAREGCCLRWPPSAVAGGCTSMLKFENKTHGISAQVDDRVIAIETTIG